MNIAIHRIITGALADELLRTHKLLFDPLDQLAIEQQSLPDELFLELLAHPDVLEFVGWTDDHQPHALIIATTRLDLIPWINAPSLVRLYPEQAETGRLFYVPCLQVHPDSQGGPLTRGVIHSLSMFLADRQGVVAFDSCQWDIDNVGIPDFIARWAKEVVEVDAREIDAQRYYAYDVAAHLDVERGDDVIIDLRDPSPDAQAHQARLDEDRDGKVRQR